LALQFANKMGCEVMAFSSGDAKKDEAKDLGASHYVNSSDAAAMKAIRSSCDLIIATAPANVDWIPYLRALRPNGVLCFVAAPSEPISLNVARIFANQSISGSSTGGRSEMREMLNFAAQHDIVAWTETLPMDSANTALERLRKNDVRYRFVLEM
jgi:alcohol/geraniol dehydrogenase (NADP+)